MIIRRLSIDYLVPGMVTAGDIYIQNDLLIESNQVLNDQMIERIAKNGIKYVPIREDVIDTKDYEPRISNDDKKNYNDLDVIRATKEFADFSVVFDKAVEKIKEKFLNIESIPLKKDELLEIIDSLLDANTNYEKLLDMLRCQREYDELIFVHSLNVNLIAGICAKWMNLDENVVNDMKLAGLLHDIGKIKLPNEIVLKPDKLTYDEYELIKKHPKIGYDLLKNSDVDESVKLAAFEHHENCDGTGYPNQLSSKEISMFARIVAIADVYDAMTAARCYRAAHCPFDVIDDIYSQAHTRFDYAYVQIFLKNIALTYRNRTVKLSDGSFGEIMFIGNNNPARPIIMTDTGLMDLSSKNDLKIVQVL